MCDGVLDLAVPIVTVNGSAKLIAGWDVGVRGRAHAVSGQRGVERCSLEHCERLAGIEAELGVQRERAGVIGRLHEPHARRARRG